MLTDYDPHQGDKSNVEWCSYQLECLEEVLGKEGAHIWLHKSNPVLDNISPINVIIETDKDKGFKIIGDLISDMLTGSPS